MLKAGVCVCVGGAGKGEGINCEGTVKIQVLFVVFPPHNHILVFLSIHSFRF